MAVTPLLSVGYPQLMLQNVLYALPTSKLIQITCDDATATFNVSNDGVTFSAANPQPSTANGLSSGWGYLVVTNKNATVNIRRWV